jgi:ubiquinone/menaquinone biosynthesis C-methylase UbiE
MINAKLAKIIETWQSPHLDGPGSCLPAIEKMIFPALVQGFFGSSPTLIVSGLQYHLGGEQDTKELARLAGISHSDKVLDVCCFLGGPAIQLAESFGCQVTGIDRSENCIVAAQKISSLCRLDHLLEFYVADAQNLPFKGDQFSVVWNQGSLDHDEAWLKEFDRVLKPEGRLALTFAIRGKNPNKDSPKWTLETIGKLVKKLGYSLDHLEDITARDIEIGWKGLIQELQRKEGTFVKALGKDWVQKAHQKFTDETEQMKAGIWGNGRMVATKRET